MTLFVLLRVFKTALFYCTVRVTVLVAVKPGLAAVMVTVEVPVGVPGTVWVCGPTPQPIIASSNITAARQSVSFSRVFLPFLPTEASPTSPSTGNRSAAYRGACPPSPFWPGTAGRVSEAVWVAVVVTVMVTVVGVTPRELSIVAGLKLQADCAG